jgi:hypothetical protein
MHFGWQTLALPIVSHCYVLTLSSADIRNNAHTSHNRHYASCWCAFQEDEGLTCGSKRSSRCVCHRRHRLLLAEALNTFVASQRCADHCSSDVSQLGSCSQRGFPWHHLQRPRRACTLRSPRLTPRPKVGSRYRLKASTREKLHMLMTRSVAHNLSASWQLLLPGKPVRQKCTRSSVFIASGYRAARRTTHACVHTDAMLK